MEMDAEMCSEEIPVEVVDSETDPDPNVLFPYTDVGLEVEGKILYVAKSILVHKSPVFKKMFESDFKEKDMKVIKLPEKKLEDVALFLKCLCPFIDHPVTVSNVMQILPVASEYIAKDIIEKCENVIYSHCMEYSKSLRSGQRDDTTMNINQVLGYLISCENYHLEERVLLAVADVACFLDCTTLEAHEDYKSLGYKSKWTIATKRVQQFEKSYKDFNRDFYPYTTSENQMRRTLKYLFQFQT